MHSPILPAGSGRRRSSSVVVLAQVSDAGTRLAEHVESSSAFAGAASFT